MKVLILGALATLGATLACTAIAPPIHSGLWSLTVIDKQGNAYVIDYNMSMSDCVARGESLAGRPAYACEIQGKGV